MRSIRKMLKLIELMHYLNVTKNKLEEKNISHEKTLNRLFKNILI
jgi:hypothetical protein